MSKAAIATALHELGFPSGLLGYEYLVHGVAMALEDWSIIRHVAKGLYPDIAAQFACNPSAVERAIRHAIETAWLRGPLETQAEYFSNSISSESGRPTNREFISAVAEHIRFA